VCNEWLPCSPKLTLVTNSKMTNSSNSFVDSREHQELPSDPYPSICLSTVPTSKPLTTPRKWRTRQPRLAISAVRNYLLRNGIQQDSITFIETELLEPDDDFLLDFFAAKQFTIVGLSGVLSHCYLQVKRIAKIIRTASPNTLIVLGGHLSTSANVVLNRTSVDFCILGDGEVPFLEFVNATREHKGKIPEQALKEINGLCYLDKTGELFVTGYGKRPLTEQLALPDYDLFLSGLLNKPELVSEYFDRPEFTRQLVHDKRAHEDSRRPNVASVPASKGCVARCTFCHRGTKGYRTVDLHELEEHLIDIIEKYDIGYITVMDENFGSNREHTRAFADLMQKYDLIWWAGGVRCTNFNEEDIKYCHDRGCCTLQFGIESGSNRILEVMEKNFTVADVKKALRVAWKYEMYTNLALMVGMPGENRTTILETGRFLGEMAYEVGIPPEKMDTAIFYALPFPGTPLYEYCQQLGLIGSTVDEEEAYLVGMADAVTSKWNYRNVSGEHPKEVLSWEIIAQLEARRVYAELQKQCKKEPTEFALRWIKHSHFKGKNTSVSDIRTLILRSEELLYRYFYVGSLTNNLPRWVAYPLVKNVYYFQIKLHNFVKRILRLGGEPFSFYANSNSVRPIPDNDERAVGMKRLEKSLRYLVRSKRTTVETQAQANQAILNKGAVG